MIFKICFVLFCSLNLLFSRSLVSDSLRPHGLQHASPLCPSPTPRVYPNSCPLSQWCHPTISFSVILFSCLQSFPASECFSMNWLFTSVAKVMELQLQWIFMVDFLLYWLVWSPCYSRESQESSALQFESISSLAFSLL